MAGRQGGDPVSDFGFGFPPMQSFFADDPFFRNGPFSSDPFFTNPFQSMFGHRRGELPGRFPAFTSPFYGLHPQLPSMETPAALSQRDPPARTSGQRPFPEQVSIQEIGHVEDEQNPSYPTHHYHYPAGRQGERGDLRHESHQQDGHHQANRKRRERHDEPIVEHPESDDEGENVEEDDETRAEEEVPRATQQTGYLPVAPSGQGHTGGFGGLFGNWLGGIHGDLISRPQDMFGAMQQQGGGGSSSYAFQSSSVSYSGIGGQTYYSSSSSRRAAGNGVYEEHHSSRNSSGHHHMTLTRGLGEKARTVSRTRKGEQDTSLEILHNVTAEEAPSFDQVWQQHAAQGLPPPAAATSRSQAQLCLPAGPSSQAHQQHQQQQQGGRRQGRGRGW